MPDSGIIVGKKYLRFTVERKLEKNQAGAYNSIGNCYLNKGNLDSALHYFEIGLAIRQKLQDKKGEAGALNNVGVVYYQRGDYSRCIEYYQRSLAIKDSLGDKAGAAASYSNIAMILQNEGNYRKALAYYNTSLHIRDSLQDDRGLGDSYLKLSAYYRHLKSYDTANFYGRLCILYATKAGDFRTVANITGNLGTIFEHKSQTDSAEFYYRNSLLLQEQVGNEEGVANSQKDLGNLYANQGKFTKAVLYCDSALFSSQRMGFARTQQEACECLAVAYDGMNQPARALQYYKMAAVLNDSLNSVEKTKEIQRKNLQYDFEKEKLQDSLRIEREAEMKEIESQQIINQKNWYILIGVSGFILMVIITFILLRGYRVKQKINSELQRKNILIGEKQKAILDSISYAKRLQEAILPSMETMRKFLKTGFVLYKPKDIVAGDFYWLEHINGTTYVAAADCTGHGVPGALVSVVCSTALNRCVLEFGITDPGKILDRTRQLVLDTFSKSSSEVNDGMDISLVAINDTEVRWAGANNPLWLFENGLFTQYKANKQPIGKTYEPKPFTTVSIARNKGMRLYLLTDGYADQFGGPHGKKFKYKQLEKVLSESNHLDMDAQGALLDSTFEKWKGSLEQVDDVCVIGIELN